MHERTFTIVTTSRQGDHDCADVKTLGAVLGISVGCIAGMFPLLLINHPKAGDCESENAHKAGAGTAVVA